MKLYLVHCGFYDTSLCEGIYESHVNLAVAASSIEEAKLRVRENCDFRSKKMHVDGLQEISVVDGFKVGLTKKSADKSDTLIINHLHRDF